MGSSLRWGLLNITRRVETLSGFSELPSTKPTFHFTTISRAVYFIPHSDVKRLNPTDENTLGNWAPRKSTGEIEIEIELELGLSTDALESCSSDQRTLIDKAQIVWIIPRSIVVHYKFSVFPPGSKLSLTERHRTYSSGQHPSLTSHIRNKLRVGVGPRDYCFEGSWLVYLVGCSHLAFFSRN
ncbi:hypothetical protein FPOAC1_002609 [Fusarium poae]|uniref:hypothetical protein n=1 Tax=Fusarium poae TaxID=36050 RepID=UPI001CE993B7|nr:hypothetical protein FPOAC1_002609 [Fusarium poae]KAG8676602.1 hypothetical protein FPOAC1_002609 [Fusarium poae]